MGWWRTPRGSIIGDPPANYLDELAEGGTRYRSVGELPPDVRLHLDALYHEGLGRPARDDDLRDLLEFQARGERAPPSDEQGVGGAA